MIVVEGLRVRFGRTVALDGIELTLEEGITGLFGPNGSGKSTLLRAVAGLVKPSQGGITFEGSPIAPAQENWRRLVGYAGHDSGLYPNLTVAENLRLFGKLYGCDPARPAGLLKLLGLENRAGTYAGELSAGLKRRAAVARALVGEPRLLLLDEPYANLDDDSAALVTEALVAWRAPGRSALIATHGARKLKAFADAGVILRRGRVVTHGRYRDPSQRRRPFHQTAAP
ncbi:MAG: heme ABC exporter ATP-binding protein CcmA [Actinomycetota bacterium]|nr:heme ABC exporter ATP-binding protein CcmA [Actinomycetota bacterium]